MIDRTSVVEALIEICRPVYDVKVHAPGRAPLVASCEFSQKVEKYMLIRRMNLWTVENEEFMHIFSVDRLTMDEWERVRGYAVETGLARAHPGLGHMATRTTAIIVCDDLDDDAAEALRRSKFVKNYRLSLHGWLELWAAAIECRGAERRMTNRHGRTLMKMLDHAADCASGSSQDS